MAKLVRVKMLERNDSLEAGEIYNLRAGPFVDFLLKEERAVALEPGESGPDLSDRGLPRFIKNETPQASGSRRRVKMLKRHCALIPDVIYNLPQGPLIDFLLDKGLAVVLLPPSQAAVVEDPLRPVAAKRKRKVVGPSELKA